ncbi:unnamed protein product [Meloidogyne enterolobii]|uniref:Uncharacterized protein n=1 Tax=Meloidogyne enterolobii TaxID=390850 RepID=A0ACB1B106_MELEN
MSDPQKSHPQRSHPQRSRPQESHPQKSHPQRSRPQKSVLKCRVLKSHILMCRATDTVRAVYRPAPYGYGSTYTYRTYWPWRGNIRYHQRQVY